jgi:hypothetical protein
MAHRGSRGVALLILDLGTRWSAPSPGRFSPGNDPVPIVQEAGWAPGPVWTGAENLDPTRIFFFIVLCLIYVYICIRYVQPALLTIAITCWFIGPLVICTVLAPLCSLGEVLSYTLD